MSHLISIHSAEIDQSLSVAAETDLTSARVRLGQRLEGTFPTVGDEGMVALSNCRHPVLHLRGIEPVGNDLSLNASVPGLVLTGPNAGGKTVVLKMMGVIALLARAGVPIPAEPGARVDFFGTVLADIGDMQSIGGDLSTFSGHLLVCKVMYLAGMGQRGDHPYPHPTHTHTRTRAHAHTRTRAHAHTRIRAHAHTRTRAHTHTRTRTHAHTAASLPGRPCSNRRKLGAAEIKHWS